MTDFHHLSLQSIADKKQLRKNLLNVENSTSVQQSGQLEDVHIDPQTLIGRVPESEHSSATSEECLHHLFEAQVRRTPEALALVVEHEHFSYAQLNQYANVLARDLQRLGVGPEVLVGLCLPRSPLLLIALLAILKAGGAYVPLDPAYPPERLRFQARDARLHLLLTSQHLHALWQELAVPQLHLDQLPALSAQPEALSNLATVVSPDYLAYLIYTSGSTGSPKGVCIAHRNTVAMVRWAERHYTSQDLSGVLAGTSVCFDLSLFELFVPWSQGGTVYLAQTPLHLPTGAQREQITLLNTVPSVMAELVRARAIPSSVRVVNLAGEAFPPVLLEQLSALTSIQRIYNLYGPSEDTTYSTWALVSPDASQTSVPIGRPLDHSQVYLLDAFGQLVPYGAIGEIYLAGVGVTRGYWQRPELTAERYVPDPFGAEPGGRLYRTGDLARYRSDGQLEYLGRVDQQVKIRGFRVELGEIEHLLSQQPQIVECVVVAHPSISSSGSVLVAYLVVNGSQEQVVEQMRAVLKARLPEYMVPRFFVVLAQLPRTSNGKIERTALPDPQRTKTHDQPKPLRTPLEQALKLSASKKVLLKKLQQQENTTSLLPLTAIDRAGQDAFPLSFAQQRLWLLDQIEPGSSTYNIPSASRLLGTLNRQALIRSLHEIVQRHEALRTAFIEVHGIPMQRISAASSFTVSCIDLRHLLAEDQHLLLDELLTQEASEAFDLRRGLLLRARLIQLHNTEHVLTLTMHHSASDGWSLEIFQRELLALYEAFDRQLPSPLAPLPIQYIDYAVWQRRWLQGAVLDRQLEYWRQQLSNLPTLLSLPTDRPRPAMQTFRGASYEFFLSSQLTSALKALSQREGTTLFMTLLAAFQIWLCRHSNQEDIVVGTPIANRQRVEIETLIGFFVNTLVLRTDLRGNPSFLEVLQRVREMSMQAYSHQDLPFEQVVEAVQPQRALSHSPLFQVFFSLLNTPASTSQPRGLQIKTIQDSTGASKFDLSLYVEELEGDAALKAHFEYNCDLFDQATIVRFAQRLGSLLEDIVARPHQHIRLLKLLPDYEYRQLTLIGHVPEPEHSSAASEECLHHLFEAQVRRTPDALALVVEHEHFSYAQLNQYANLLARDLQRLGVGPEVLVGLCLPRSPLLLIALLAILKAGGAYVPLDPAYPPERLRFQARDARLHLLLTSQHLHALWQELAVPQLHLDQLPALSAQPEALSNLATVVSPDYLAYLIYTSGSTGSPKGVCIAHRNTVAMVRWAERHYTSQDLSGVLAGTSVCFDLSLFELFVPWSQGGTVYLAQTPLHLPTGAQREQITLLNTVPSVMAELVRARAIPSSVRVVNLAGEAFPPVLLEQLSALTSIQRIYNLYGPSEDTTYSTWALVSPDVSQTSVPIGRPLDHSQVYLLDTFGQLVPYGAIGEIYLAGVGVTRGYWQRPELTAERYVPDPFGAEPGGRLYRTGDLARYRSDGQLEYLGRVDQQVKIRGFRVELGEIEHLLSQQPQIVECVVVAHPSISSSGSVLVAYLVVNGSQEQVVEQMRAVLKARLPEYMVPRFFVVLPQLPRTSNGKVERTALPDPQRTKTPDQPKHLTQARTPLEQEIAMIWASVLHTDPPGRTENFFEIGGHSLSGVQIIARIRDQFRVNLPLRQIFETPTVQDLAHIISQSRLHGTALLVEDEPELQRVSRDQALPLSFAQQRLWILEQLNPGTSTYNIPLAVRLTGALDKRALLQSLRAIVARHETLRTTFQVSEGMPSQYIASSPTTSYPINFSLIDARNWPSAEREQLTYLLIRAEASQPFDLATGPLIRGHLLWVDDTDYILLLTLHHIISDAWSLGVISRELGTLYQAFCAGVPAQLPELPVQYADYAVWQRQSLQGEALERMLQYWKQQLAELPAVLTLPADRARPARQTFNGSNHTFYLSHNLTSALQRIGQSEGATLFMTLLATFQLLLCRYSGQEDIAIATPVANRTRVAIENLIGFFINTLVLRTDLRENPSFRTLLQRVRSVALDAYLHQDVPFEQVVNAVQPERDMAYAPLCQVAFQLQNISQEALELPGITLQTLDIESTTTKFDLTLTMSECEQGLRGEFEYNSDLFDKSTIARMAGHFQSLLESVVAQPEQRIWHLPMLGAAEFQQMVYAWNQTSVAYPLERLTHQLVEVWAERNPEALALLAGTERITYRELNQRANQLAHYLLARGLQPGNVVGIYQERTIAMIVSLLAVFKAGGAYMPIDPAYPVDRLMFMLSDSQAMLLLTQERLAQKLTAMPAINLLSVDTEQVRLSLENTSNPSVTLKGDDLAYVIYTSGSTGLPKGVAVQHRALLNLVYWHQRACSIRTADRSTHLAGLGFDATVWELWPYLAAGAQVHLADDETRISPQLWQAWINQQGITISFLPTPLAEQALTLDWSESTPLRILHTGGDQLHHYPATHMPFTFINNYGPTENTVVATSTIIPAQEQSSHLPAIGRPIDNTQVYVLDQELQPQPIGVPGELYIGGASLAQGYLYKPELTAERFVPHPFSAQPGERLYRTGDLVRYLADGSLEFLGRRDYQVKIRGYRIELGEIAGLLTAHPEIRENIVIVCEDQPGEKRLVAYVVTRQLSQITSEQLYSYLREKLPAYMVPAAIVILDELPTNANGKVDRQALPQPSGERASSRAYMAPRDTVELQLIRIWENLLQSSPISIKDDFFELGGHSLLAVRLMAQIQREFQRDLPLSTLFQGATPEQLATALRQDYQPEKRSALIAIQPDGPRQPFFCIHPVGGEVLCYVDLARQLGPEQPFYGLQMPLLQTMDRDALQEVSPSIEEMAFAYLTEVQRIQPTGPYLLGGWSLGGVIAFEMAQQLERRGQKTALLALFDSYAPSIHQQNTTPSIQQFVEDLEGLFDQTLSIDYAKLQMLSHKEQLAQLYAYLKCTNIVPPDIGPEYLSRLFSTYRQNVKALHSYQPQAYPGRLTLFHAASSTESNAVEKIHGWSQFLQQKPVIHTISGNHYTILKNPHLDPLVEYLKYDLESATEGKEKK